MLSFSEDKLVRAYEKASPAIKSILNDTWIPSSSDIIGKKLQMRVDKVGELIRIIGFVLLDLMPISRFTDAIEQNLEMDRRHAEDVAKEVDQHIFSQIRTKVREYNTKDKGDHEIKDDSLMVGLQKDAEKFAPEESTKINKTILVDPYRESFDD